MALEQKVIAETSTQATTNVALNSQDSSNTQNYLLSSTYGTGVGLIFSAIINANLKQAVAYTAISSATGLLLAYKSLAVKKKVPCPQIQCFSRRIYEEIVDGISRGEYAKMPRTNNEYLTSKINA